jgi:hypothetical protein
MSPPVDNNVDVGQKKIGDGKRGNCDLLRRPNIAPLDASWNVDALGMNISASTIQTRRSEPGRISFVYYTYKQQDGEKISMNAPSICLQARQKQYTSKHARVQRSKSRICATQFSKSQCSKSQISKSASFGFHDVKTLIGTLEQPKN